MFSRQQARVLSGCALIIGCGSEAAPVVETPPDTTPPPCAAGTYPTDGGCVPAGTQPNGCTAGELGVDGGCRPAGIPPELCADGFASDGEGGCIAILPSEPCAPGTMATPGETVCREVAPCRAGAWGGIPVASDTQHVDAAYAGGSSDGSSDHPWPTIQQGVDAAVPGAIVAVANGTYAENVSIAGKHVRLWGRCPGEVAIDGDATAPAIDIGIAADGTEVRAIAVTGASAGIAVSGSENVLVDEVWIHDLDGRGLRVWNDLGTTSATLRGSLVERATDLAVGTRSAELVMETSVVRDTPGAGVAFSRQSSLVRSTGTVRSCVVERNVQSGVHVQAADATIEGTFIADTLPGAAGFGVGIEVTHDDGPDGRSSALVRSVVVERSHGFGVRALGSDATIELSVIRDTQPDVEQNFGRGVEVVDHLAKGERSNVTMESVVVDENHEAGVAVHASDLRITAAIVRDTRPNAAAAIEGDGVYAGPGANLLMLASRIERNANANILLGGAHADIEGCLVRDARPQASDQLNGFGIVYAVHAQTAAPATGKVSYSVVENSLTMGVFVMGSDLGIDASIVRDTAPEAATGEFGQGIAVQAYATPANASVRWSLVERSAFSGISVVDSEALIEATLVRETQPHTTAGFGDGILVFANNAPTGIAVSGARVESSARAGIASFGAAIALGQSTLECNPIQLDLEPFEGRAGAFEDAGGNTCGCGGATGACKVLSSGLTPPEALKDL